MMDHRLHCSIMVALSLLCAGAAPSASAPAGLEKVLHGIKSGLSLAEFEKEHPKAVNETPDASPPETPARDASRFERWENDPMLGLNCLANYGFRDGALREFVVLWAGNQEDVTKQRQAFLAACVWKHGREFRREIIKINPRKENPPLVPVLVWEDEHAVFLASMAWNADSEQAAGTFTYAMYAKDDPFPGIVLLANELAPEVVKDAYAELEPLLQELTPQAGSSR